MNSPLVVSFGGGINSAAMLIGMVDKGVRPDAIVFADTGNEKPETYAFVSEMRAWCLRHLDLGIITVGHPKGDTLRESCFRNGTLPSKAYGFPGCSVKFKHQPMEKYEMKRWGPDAIITKAIGYHAGETRRSDIAEKGRYRYRYFLREWGWGQQDCEDAIIRIAGLPVPMKSACYFCPSSKPHEIAWLRDVHPELFADAVAMETQAIPYHAERPNADGTLKTLGLGRKFAWSDFVNITPAQVENTPEPDQIPCMCYDGGDE